MPQEPEGLPTWQGCYENCCSLCLVQCLTYSSCHTSVDKCMWLERRWQKWLLSWVLKACVFWTDRKKMPHIWKRKILRNQVGEFSVCQFILRVTKIRWSMCFKRGYFTKWHGNNDGGSRRTKYVAPFPTLDLCTPYIKWKKRKSETKRLYQEKTKSRKRKEHLRKMFMGSKSWSTMKHRFQNVEAASGGAINGEWVVKRSLEEDCN